VGGAESAGCCHFGESGPTLGIEGEIWGFDGLAGMEAFQARAFVEAELSFFDVAGAFIGRCNYVKNSGGVGEDDPGAGGGGEPGGRLHEDVHGVDDVVPGAQRVGEQDEHVGEFDIVFGGDHGQILGLVLTLYQGLRK